MIRRLRTTFNNIQSQRQWERTSDPRHQSKDVQSRAAEAVDESTPPERLATLVWDDHPLVAQSAAANPNLPVETQWEVYESGEYDTRWVLAGNAALDPGIRTELSYSGDPNLVYELVQNPQATAAELSRAIATNPRGHLDGILYDSEFHQMLTDHPNWGGFDAHLEKETSQSEVERQVTPGPTSRSVKREFRLQDLQQGYEQGR